ncbi:MAG: radical SAM protein, partial [Deltaproteobacteria bacterium]|nr:radical SAM protein [Deltaproteobacteria bacterium]
MRIVFVDGPWPHFGHRTQRWAHKNPGGNINPPPLFQMYAASVARKRGFDVALWDAPVRDMGFEDVVEEITQFSPDLIVQNTSTASFDHDVRLAHMLKRKKDWPLVMVGPHVTALADQIMRKVSAVDLIALGEYDETIADVASNLDDLSRVSGIVYRDGKDLVRTEARPLIRDLDTLPFPAWDLVDIHRYWESMFPWTKRPVATIMSSRGCNFRCSFCPYPQVLFQFRLRLRDLSRVVDEIQWLKKRFGARFFYFEDDNFTASWKRVETFCRLLLERGVKISWGCLSRTDKVTEERIRLMKKSGCFLIKYGVESGVQSTLDAIEKHKPLRDVVHAFAVTKKVGITAHATVMVGAAHETRETIYQTREFVKKLGPDSVQFSICTPLPGTKFWDECEANGWLSYHEWEDFDGVTGRVLEYPGLSKKEIREAVQNSYLDYYSSPAHIRQRLKTMIFGPERVSQFVRNFWLLKR